MEDLISVITLIVGIGLCSLSICIYEKNYDYKVSGEEYRAIHEKLINILSKYNPKMRKDEIKEIIEEVCVVVFEGGKANDNSTADSNRHS